MTLRPEWWKWAAQRYQGTIIHTIWPEMLFFILVATMVCLVSELRTDLGISNALLTVLGTVLGLVISFRTSSAYERYQEGRKLWTSITLASRNMASLIWIQIPLERLLKGQPEDPSRNLKLESILEKKSMVNLVQAFSVAVKHDLRGEPGIYYEDLYPLVSFLPRYAPHPGVPPTENLPVWDDFGAVPIVPLVPGSVTPGTTIIGSEVGSPSGSPVKQRQGYFDEERGGSGSREPSSSGHGDCEFELRPARNPPTETIYDKLPILFVIKPIFTVFLRLFFKADPADAKYTLTGKKRRPPPAESNVPLEIMLFLSSYFAHLMREGSLVPAVATAFMNNLNALQDAVANLERVRSTPIPYAYQVHLRMSLWLYLILLPFQIYSSFKWLTIPGTAFAAFLYLGFLEIGQEIEDPFGYDLNDINVDEICLDIEREMHEITAHPAPDPKTYVFSAVNKPFLPTDPRSAQDILLNVHHEYHAPEIGLGSVHRTMLKNWRQKRAKGSQSEAD